MTKEEEFRANTSVAVVQAAWEHMANMAISAKCEAEALRAENEELKERIKGLENDPSP
jgi:cell division protein FtsB